MAQPTSAFANQYSTTIELDLQNVLAQAVDKVT